MDVKAKLADFDQAGLVNLVHDLYAAQKDNQAFLHARFGLGEDVLAPSDYKKPDYRPALIYAIKKIGRIGRRHALSPALMTAAHD